MTPTLGLNLDPQTRCAHYRTDHDVVAIRFYCCGGWYACHACHEALAGHPIRPWPADRLDEPAVACGACGATFSAREYLDRLRSDPACPACSHGWNPGCLSHAAIYFEA